MKHRHVNQVLMTRKLYFRVATYEYTVCSFTEELWIHNFQMNKSTFFELCNTLKPLLAPAASWPMNKTHKQHKHTTVSINNDHVTLMYVRFLWCMGNFGQIDIFPLSINVFYQLAILICAMCRVIETQLLVYFHRHSQPFHLYGSSVSNHFHWI